MTRRNAIYESGGDYSMTKTELKRAINHFYDVSNVVDTASELSLTISANGNYVADVTVTGSEISVADSETGGVHYYDLSSVTANDIRHWDD